MRYGLEGKWLVGAYSFWLQLFWSMDLSGVSCGKQVEESTGPPRIASGTQCPSWEPLDCKNHRNFSMYRRMIWVGYMDFLLILLCWQFKLLLGGGTLSFSSWIQCRRIFHPRRGLVCLEVGRKNRRYIVSNTADHKYCYCEHPYWI